MSAIGTGLGQGAAALASMAALSARAAAATQGAMHGAAANTAGQNKLVRNEGRARALVSAGNASRKKCNITDALMKPARKKGA